jgi:hypothetical protein
MLPRCYYAEAPKYFSSPSSTTLTTPLTEQQRSQQTLLLYEGLQYYATKAPEY